jgi:PAS domain S-box-containing protein
VSAAQLEPAARPAAVKVLLVDDRADQLTALEALLSEPGVELVKVRSGRAALREVLRHDFAAILLDVNMPGMDGFETAALIRQRQRSADTPILFVTSMTDTETHASRGYSLGAVDYIHRPMDPEVMRTKVRVFIELFRKTEEVRRQAEELRELEAREHHRALGEAMERLDAESKRNLFFALSVDMLCIVGFDGYFKQLNPAWEKVLGHDEEALRAAPLVTFIHLDDREATLERLRELREGMVISYFECRFARRDGSYRWLGWTASPYPADQHLYMFARDITEQKRAEQEHEGRLVEEQQRAAQLQKLTSASLAINSARVIEDILQATADQARTVLDGAAACVRLVPERARSHMGHRVILRRAAAAPNGQEPSCDSELLARATELNRPLRLSRAELDRHPELGSHARGGATASPERDWLSAPLTGRDGRNMGLIQIGDAPGGFSHDDELLLVQLAQIASVTVENALYLEAREANRLKDEFLAMLSHELRTPLNAVLGWTQLLRIGQLGPEETTRALEIIERNVRIQGQLIEDLLDVSRIITGKLRLHQDLIEPAPAVTEAVDALRPEAESKQIRLTVRVEPGSGRVRGDAERLQQVVWNLVSNAIKFTPQGGSVRVTLARRDGLLELVVSDDGEGIHRELLPHVFERFHQGEGSGGHGGLGLGLTIVRHLAELHGGSVAADSGGSGRGATFTVRLPAVDETEASAPEVAVPFGGRFTATDEERPRLDGIRVLVVEDQADTREFVTTALQNQGAEVVAVESASTALEALDRFRADLLISDIAMPGDDGYALMRRVRARPPELGGHLPALALTAYARDQDRSQALDSGFQLHLAKPIVLPRLLRAVAALARRSAAPVVASRGPARARNR